MRATCYQIRGEETRSKNDLDSSIADWIQLVELDPDRALEYRHQRGRSYQIEGDYRAAIAEWSESIRLYPDKGRVYDWLANILATCLDSSFRDGKKALEYAKALSKTNPLDDPAMGLFAAACAEMGDFDQAVQWQKKSIGKMQPTNGALEGAQEPLRLYENHQPFHAAPWTAN